jgi:putative 4-mercaptohistidine N1-methyltranferase
LAEYLAFHYLEPRALFPGDRPVPLGIRNFPAACASLLLSEARRRKIRIKRALDLGCAVGRASFELARKVPEVVGIDFSKTFIAAAEKFASAGMYCFRLREEGRLSRPWRALAPFRNIGDRVCFRPGDAMRLPELGTFDLVLAANLLDRVKDPKKLLRQVLPGLVRPGGLLLLTSPYTWSKEFTPRNRWLQDSFPAMRKILSPHFRLLRRQDLPFLLREHRRKFQLTFADATLWLRH